MTALALNGPLVQLFISAFVTLFVVIDPPGCVPIFSSLTAGTSPKHRMDMAVRSSLIAGGVLIAFALGGESFLSALGITLPAFKIAGGLMVFVIAIDMVFEKRTQRRESRAEEVKSAADAAGKPLEEEDISVFPMAIPMLAGPGSIASVMLLSARTGDLVQEAVVLGALVAVLLLTLLCLLAAGPIMKLMGAKFEGALTRLLGVVLAALAAQFVIDGIKQSFGL
ncbi:MarC family protein [Sandarakinorhabdus oryzae]|uniref:MarC family protein n=1 Tax=Sandarakinorhabdus oryzae TaxID=2675220 RepID=UPI001F200FF6|nr:MarC family protein [Sandarakinorhabdus oryzae]